MMGVSLFGTCTMKYNPRLATELAARPEIAELHPDQDDETLQGVLELVHGLDLILRGLSGHGRSSSSSRAAAPTPRTRTPCITRAYHAAARRARTARRDRDHDPGAPVQRRDRGGRRLQDRHAPARGERLPVARRAQGGRLRAHGLADGQQPRRHGRLQPGDRQVGRGRPRRRRALLLRPRELQRRDGQAQGARARLRRVHVHAPQDLRRAEGRRRARRSAPTAAPRSWRGSCPRPSSSSDGERLPARPRPARDASARCASSGATCRSSSTRTRGAARWARRGSSEAVRHLRAREQLHGEAPARDPRRHEVAPAPDGAAAGDDALQPRARSSRRPGITRRSTSRTGWSTSGSTRSGSATSRGSCRSRSRPRPARCGRRRTSTSGSTCSRTSSTRRTRTRRSCAPRRTTRRSASSAPTDLERPATLGDDVARAPAQAAGPQAAAEPAGDRAQRRERARPACSSGRVALVTGGARGLGAAIARAFAGSGRSRRGRRPRAGPAPEGWISLDRRRDGSRPRSSGRCGDTSSASAASTSSSPTPASSRRGATPTTSTSTRSTARLRGQRPRRRRDDEARRRGRSKERGGAIVVMASLNAWHARPRQAVVHGLEARGARARPHGRARSRAARDPRQRGRPRPGRSPRRCASGSSGARPRAGCPSRRRSRQAAAGHRARPDGDRGRRRARRALPRERPLVGITGALLPVDGGIL